VGQEVQEVGVAELLFQEPLELLDQELPIKATVVEMVAHLALTVVEVVVAQEP